jgi:CRP/FNR family transcriptional regulator, cyclic AMP receptor protein
MDTLWYLHEQDFFSGLNAEKKAFISHSKKKDIRKNEFLFSQGEAGDSVFYLESGEVRISSLTPHGKESIVFIRHGGELFGLAEAMGGVPRTCSAQATTACHLYEIGRMELEELLSRNWALSRRVMEVLGGRLRYLGEQLGNLMSCDVSTRLSRLLFYLSCYKQIDPEVWNASDAIPVRLTQEQMASMIGSCQQTVSEILKQFEAEGMIRVSRNRREIIILKPVSLV